MNFDGTTPTPARHTPDGGVLVGSVGARRRLVVFEDPQCPHSRQFEEVSGDLLRREVAAGAVAVEYRMRCFLGPESVRAVNALALAAEAGRFDELRWELLAAQPPEHTGGFTTEDLLDFGRRAGTASRSTPECSTTVKRWVRCCAADGAPWPHGIGGSRRPPGRLYGYPRRR